MSHGMAMLVLQLGGGSRHPGLVDAAAEAEHAWGGPLQATYCCSLGFAGLTRGGAVPGERRPGAVGALVAACKQPSCAVTTSFDIGQTVTKPTSLAPQVGFSTSSCQALQRMHKDTEWKNGATPLPSVALTSVASVGSMAPLSEPEPEPEPEPLPLPSSSEPLVPALLPLSERGRPISLPLLQSPLEPPSPSPVDPFSAKIIRVHEQQLNGRSYTQKINKCLREVIALQDQSA